MGRASPSLSSHLEPGNTSLCLQISGFQGPFPSWEMVCALGSPGPHPRWTSVMLTLVGSASSP